ncbi:MAG: hypothetical protein DMG92_03295 [Acidobacteria bacterium]|nr:MAG: hypothetical protein DMG92_03295 [Acidobacteriota bacterium]
MHLYRADLARRKRALAMRQTFRGLGIVTIAFALSGSLLAQTTIAPKKRRAASAAPAASQQDVQALRDTVQAQQRQIEAQNQQMQQLQSELHQVLDAVQRSNAAAQEVQSRAEQAQTTAAQAQQSAADAQHAATEANSAANTAESTSALLQTQAKQDQKKLEAFQSVLGHFRFTGDIRVRGENYAQSGTQDRNRARVRVRLGIDGKLSEDFVGGLAIATGSLGDPTTTNETLTNAFDRKTIGLDRGFITYNPAAASWLSLTGGKFAYQWQRTSVTGDPDLNPEGFDQKISFNTKAPTFWARRRK